MIDAQADGSRPALMDILFGEVDGPIEVPHDPSRLDRVALTSRVIPVHPLIAENIERVRALLVSGALPEYGNGPLPQRAHLFQGVVCDHLDQYVPKVGAPVRDQLYVLDFQGPHRRSYVMFGHTTDLRARIIAHTRSATPHGYALLQGWASPPMLNAQPLEQVALNLMAGFAGDLHYRERFYNTDFELAKKVLRVVFELRASA